MDQIEQCSLCQTKECKVIPNANNRTGHLFQCPTCGDYIISERVHDVPSSLQSRKENLYIISGVTRNYFERNNSPFTITYKMLYENSEFETKILSQEPKTVLGKAELLLQYINRKSSYPGDEILIEPSKDYTVCFCKKAEELRFYLNHLNETRDIKIRSINMEFYYLSLSAEGWQKIDSMAKPNAESKQAFVAMWFDDSMDKIFADGIESIEKEVGFNMFRVDKTHFIDEKICDKIITEIKKSRFLIADVTKQRQAVYFEAGYAMGMRLPIIWTCHESEVNNCCFDTRQYPHIFWKDAEDLRTQLKEKILATISKPEK